MSDAATNGRLEEAVRVLLRVAEGDVEQAHKEVFGFLVRLASNLLSVLWSQKRRDRHSAEDLADFVMLQLLASKYDSDRQSFSSWAWTIIRNRIFSLKQKEQRQKLHDDMDNTFFRSPTKAANPRFWTSPFSRDELEEISSWGPPQHRVLLLVIAGLHKKVPADLWQSWCRQAGFAQPFPPAGIDREGYWTGKIPDLAKHLEIKSNTLNQLWKRKKHLLARLDSITDP
ncbi:MAG: hypothetical protein KatS3mg110_1988 [Pirellulaceae bacterium]|nr:MAG: hypothetical protein KatS3mg110_1988 [Pirellulaceae bacterium]